MLSILENNVFTVIRINSLASGSQIPQFKRVAFCMFCLSVQAFLWFYDLQYASKTMVFNVKQFYHMATALGLKQLYELLF
jgi:hypothetical protein